MVKIKCKKCGQEAYSAARFLKCECGGFYYEAGKPNSKTALKEVFVPEAA